MLVSKKPRKKADYGAMFWGTYCRLNLHVSASTRDVLRAAQKVIKPEARYSRKARKQRHFFYRNMLAMHNRAVELYQKVNTGS